MIGSGVIFCGAADRYLGMLAATLGDVDAAEAHFAAALRLNRDMGAITWLAHSCYQTRGCSCPRSTGSRRAPHRGGAGPCRAGGHARAARPHRRPPLEAPSDPSSPRRSHAARVEVLVLVSRGRSNREVASALSIGDTAANHVKSILRKARCANRTEAASCNLTSAAWSSTDHCLIMPQCLSTSSNVGSPRRSW